VYGGVVIVLFGPQWLAAFRRRTRPVVTTPKPGN
jgi:hypothetical protein